jgi:hypothetical protein
MKNVRFFAGLCVLALSRMTPSVDLFGLADLIPGKCRQTRALRAGLRLRRVCEIDCALF